MSYAVENQQGFQSEMTTATPNSMSSANTAAGAHTNNIADDANSSTDVKPVSIFSSDYKK